MPLLVFIAFFTALAAAAALVAVFCQARHNADHAKTVDADQAVGAAAPVPVAPWVEAVASDPVVAWINNAPCH
jgi:hypothetical protein